MLIFSPTNLPLSGTSRHLESTDSTLIGIHLLLLILSTKAPDGMPGPPVARASCGSAELAERPQPPSSPQPHGPNERPCAERPIVRHGKLPFRMGIYGVSRCMDRVLAGMWVWVQRGMGCGKVIAVPIMLRCEEGTRTLSLMQTEHHQTVGIEESRKFFVRKQYFYYACNITDRRGRRRRLCVACFKTLGINLCQRWLGFPIPSLDEFAPDISC